MPRILRTSLAEKDLASIWTYIADDNVSAADRLVDRIDQAFKMLAASSDLGETMAQFRPGLRAWTIGSYVIYYSATDEGIEVCRVLHAARRREDLL